MRQRAVGPAGDNRLECGTLEPRAAEHLLDVCGDVELGSAWTRERNDIGHNRAEASTRLAQNADLFLVLHHPPRLHRSFDRNESRARIGALQRRRRRGRERGGQLVEATHRQMRAFDADSPGTGLLQRLGQRIVEAAGGHHQAEQWGDVGA